MEQIVEFINNHFLLVSVLVTLLSILFFKEIYKGGRGVTSQEVTQLINQQGAIVVDVREKSDFSQGHIVASINIPYSKIKERLGTLNKYKDNPIIIVDTMGYHSSDVGRQFKEHLSIKKVVRLKGGINAWILDNLPLVKK